MQVVVQAILTNYLTIGSGQKIILFLHGWANSIQTFDSLAKQFVKDNSSYTAVLVDLPGFGKTQIPKDGWDLKDYAQFVADFIVKTKYKPTVVVGHSNGGAIAIYGVSHKLFNTKGLVLIGSAGIRIKTQRNVALKVASLPAKLALKVLPNSAQRSIKQKAYQTIGSDYMVSEHMQETFKKVISTDVQAEAASITIPTYLIYGSDDNATPVTYGELFKKLIPKSELLVIPEAGHFVHQEQVYKVATGMSGFSKNL